MPNRDSVPDVSSQSWDEDVLKFGLPVGVFFWTPRCKWSRALLPLYLRAADQYQGRLRLTKVNVEENPDIASRYGVESTPTIKFFFLSVNVSAIVGYLSADQLQEEVYKVVERHREIVNRTCPTTTTPVCPYCGETTGCHCCIGYGSATGG